jgi:glyoxylase-like metal-dependent hydrolase (beta-lactamase superfamily II)
VTAPIRYDQVVGLSALVRRVTQPNPGLFTGPGTNTHLVGTSSLIILDPGEDRDDGHFDRIVAAVGSARVAAVIPSHGHPDHWPLAPRLAARFGAPVWFFGRHDGFAADRSLGDGEVLETAGIRLEAIHTPGHTPDHLAFLLAQERALFPGDVVMGWSTSIIAPPEGDLRHYLASLRRLLAVPGLEVLYPAHGEAIATPYDRIRELVAHREMRTRQALEALGDGPSRIAELVARIYAEVDPALHPAAARSMLAHLLALETDGRLERQPGTEALPWDRVVWQLRRH